MCMCGFKVDICGLKGLGAPVLVLAFLSPLLWAADVFWKVCWCCMCGYTFARCVKKAYDECFDEKKPEAGGWVLVGVAAIVIMVMGLVHGSKWAKHMPWADDDENLGSASNGTELIDEWD